MNDLINQPDAPRLIYGLRDTGYSFNTAAADIIDNSIAANATEVNVRIELAEDGRKFVCFGDNGDGMDSEMLFDAMRYGAPARANLASLGKFGLGGVGSHMRLVFLSESGCSESMVYYIKCPETIHPRVPACQEFCPNLPAWHSEGWCEGSEAGYVEVYKVDSPN